MSDDLHVDGNALGGLLMEVFGREMTDARGCCAQCSKVNQLGAMRVYHGPGDVGRCPTCDNVVLVTVTVHEVIRVHPVGLRWLEPA